MYFFTMQQLKASLAQHVCVLTAITMIPMQNPALSLSNTVFKSLGSPVEIEMSYRVATGEEIR